MILNIWLQKTICLIICRRPFAEEIRVLSNFQGIRQKSSGIGRVVYRLQKSLGIGLLEVWPPLPEIIYILPDKIWRGPDDFSLRVISNSKWIILNVKNVIYSYYKAWESVVMKLRAFTRRSRVYIPLQPVEKCFSIYPKNKYSYPQNHLNFQCHELMIWL